MKVFWPLQGIGAQEGQLLGWSVGDSIVVVGVQSEACSSTSPQLSVAEAKASENSLEVVGRARIGANSVETHDDAQDLSIWLDLTGCPASSSRPVELILFTPPDPSRLRFFSLGRRLARSDPSRQEELSMLDAFSRWPRLEAMDAMEAITPLLNEVFNAQKALRAGRPISNPPPVRQKVQVGPEEVPAVSGSPAWLDLTRRHSATVKQLSLRIEQLRTMSGRFRLTRSSALVPVSMRSEHYISFWNTVWLILNDLILGYCARQCLILVTPLVLARLPELISWYLVHLPITALHWLDEWPIGLKLNTPLSAFFTTAYGLILLSWNASVLPHLSCHLPALLDIIAIAPLGGLTLLLAMTQDALALITLHLRLCHILSSTLCRWQMTSLGGLWNLFRGKRWNVLRQRTDSYAYDVDQLFLGTLLFTVSIFLLPTVGIYAALFGVVRVTSVFADRVFGIAVTALNAFPLFELMLRIKEPSRLPAGITFDLHVATPDRSSTVEGAHNIRHALKMRNAPKTVTDILRL